MSYIVERKVNGNIYRYEIESYWDKDKKQPRQRSKYLGPKEKAITKKIKKALGLSVSKCYGNIFLLFIIISAKENLLKEDVLLFYRNKALLSDKRT